MLSLLNYPTILIGTLILIIVLLFLFRKVTLKSQCPVCGDHHPDRIARAYWLKALQPILPVKAYRCLNCQHKFYQLGTGHSHAH